MQGLIEDTRRHSNRSSTRTRYGSRCGVAGARLVRGSFLPTLGAVGFLGCLYYWFPALSTVTPAPEVQGNMGRFNELKEEWDALKE